MRLYGELHRFIPVLAAYRGFRVAEIPVNHRARQHGRSRYGPERYLRGFFDLLSVTFMGRYRHRPLHLFGGVGAPHGSGRLRDPALPHGDLVLGRGHRDRPLLTLGVLLMVVGIQFVSLGLLSELITSQHEERMDERERTEQLVEDVSADLGHSPPRTSSDRQGTPPTSTETTIAIDAGAARAVPPIRSTQPSQSMRPALDSRRRLRGGCRHRASRSSHRSSDGRRRRGGRRHARGTGRSAAAAR